MIDMWKTFLGKLFLDLAFGHGGQNKFAHVGHMSLEHLCY